ncbi:hypothetical protein AB0M50_29410 [Nonomuraea fuscirosea]|uniref:hypothetical protein n=1 Tax=Nonomuraea fuscirosea TaxID=1291556 RepID=UPI00342A0E75
MSTKALFIEHLRRERLTLLRPDTPPEIVARALELLGLDDPSLDRWARSRTSLISLPHASPNVFDPRTRVGWFAGEMQRQVSGLHHVRVVLTHTNFSDLGWRPYAWWYLSDGVVRRHRLFSRNKKQKHCVISSRPPLDVVPEGMTGADLSAARAAIWGSDLAASFMLIGAVIERAAGMIPGPVATYLPLTMLVSFVRELASRASSPDEQGASPAAWCGRLIATTQGRRVAPDGTLRECSGDRAEVLDNYGNLASLALLEDAQVLGGAKMAGYWPDVEAVAARIQGTAPEGFALPCVLMVPELDLLSFAGPSPDVAAQLERQGVRYSQGLAVAEHGCFAARGRVFGAAALTGTDITEEA